MTKSLFSLITTLLLEITGYGQVFSEIQKGTAIDCETEDRLSWAAGTSGSYALIGLMNALLGLGKDTKLQIHQP
ncbi:MAG: hypothetical protein ACI8ZM_005531 [Crocinitomix sp.]|jgi:hypothetical protein